MPSESDTKVKGSKAKQTIKTVTKAIGSGLIKSCHDLSEGGLAMTAGEMAFAGGFGWSWIYLKCMQRGYSEMTLYVFRI